MEVLIIIVIALVVINLISSYTLDNEVKTLLVDNCKPHKWGYNSDGNLQCKICKLDTKESLKK